MFDMTQFNDHPAGQPEMLAWAQSVMQREPDLRIGNGYMDRWYILPKNPEKNVYLHRLYRDDEDVQHDHPWDSTSWVISGGFIEQTPSGRFARLPGDVVNRKAADPHRLELIDGVPSITLFFTGPRVREWGFHCRKGWVDWRTFTGGYHEGRSERGAGCGEYA